MTAFLPALRRSTRLGSTAALLCSAGLLTAFLTLLLVDTQDLLRGASHHRVDLLDEPALGALLVSLSELLDRLLAAVLVSASLRLHHSLDALYQLLGQLLDARIAASALRACGFLCFATHASLVSATEQIPQSLLSASALGYLLTCRARELSLDFSWTAEAAECT